MILAPVTSPALLLFSSGAEGSPVVASLFMYGAIFAIFYFILIRPQQRQRRQHEQLIQNLKKGDEVVTAGGVVGEVLFIKETVKDGTPQKTMDDRVTIKSGESRLIIERGKIVRIVSAGAPGTTAA
jgi:preprotein translocase subunit YajC